ncbi:hypothetical protein J437_LFUL012737 [Ladona fulva]|uniref:Cytochrome P450 n=1 Tax=Ladona fulva TaxID=123851 RepID=A0A8K0KTT3_LADFU|nr:hypothetical protein J437_LFUL012737 [Ladona fulva]
MMITDLVLLLILFFCIWKLLIEKPHGFPPGPFRWPIIGNMYELFKWGPYLYQSMKEMARRYGEVAGFYVGFTPVVIVSGFEAIKELSFTEDLAGRPLVLRQRMDNERHGILFIDGPRLKEQRRFSLRHLRDFGLGKTSMENITLEEIESVIEGVEELRGTDKQQWSKPRYGFKDHQLTQLLAYVRFIIAHNEFGPSIAMGFPKLAATIPHLTHQRKNKPLSNQLINFITGGGKATSLVYIEEMSHVFNRRDGQTQGSVGGRQSKRLYGLVSAGNREKERSTGTYIQRIDIPPYINVSFVPALKGSKLHFSEKQLSRICFDLFAAGYDTTFNTITFSILFMILNPGVQLKVQEELDSVVGKDRFPSFQDRDRQRGSNGGLRRLTYTEATIHEVLRCSSVVPLSVPHAPLKDTSFRGHVIPKGTTIFLNLYNHHRDPKIWGDPDNFRPERFIDENGVFKRHEAVIPFGVANGSMKRTTLVISGKRACLGESLARNNLFLFFTCLMQKYSWRIPEGEQRPSDEPVGNITIVSKPFKVQVLPRK